MDPPLAVLDKPNKMTMKFKCYALKNKKKKHEELKPRLSF